MNAPQTTSLDDVMENGRAIASVCIVLVVTSAVCLVAIGLYWLAAELRQRTLEKRTQLRLSEPSALSFPDRHRQERIRKKDRQNGLHHKAREGIDRGREITRDQSLLEGIKNPADFMRVTDLGARQPKEEPQ